MVGPTAQLIALCCHFNGRSQGVAVGPFFPTHSTCRFCEYIHFLRYEKRWLWWSRWKEIAATPDAWLEIEAVPGRFARLVHGETGNTHFSDRMSAGFVGGGGRWLFAVVSANGPSLWEPSWEVGNQNAEDQRIWRVRYGLLTENAAMSLPKSRDPESVSIELKETLSEIATFAEEHSIDGFASSFRKAIGCLASDDPFADVYHQDLAPPGLLALPAQRLMAACQAAWVFGGMGSWNDLSFDGDDQKRYETISDRLFALVNEGICSSANSTASGKA